MLGCGHSTRDVAGYAMRNDGTRICYACADDEQRAALLTQPAIVGYLTYKPCTITTWTGGKLMDVTYVRFVTMRGFNGSHYERFYVNAVDVHGQRRHGNGRGYGMYVRMRRTKGRTI